MPFAMMLLANPWARLVAVGVFCFGLGFVKAWNSFPRIDIAAIERNAISGRDAYWQARLNEETAAHEARISEALEVGQAIAATPVDQPERLRLCRADANCRGKNSR